MPPEKIAIMIATKRPQRSRAPRHGGAWIFFGVLLVLFAALCGVGMALLPAPGLIVPGVQVAGIALGGMTAVQASGALVNSLGNLSDKQVTLTAGDEQDTLALSQLGINLDTAATLRDAMATGRQGALPLRLWQLARMRWGRGTAPVRPAFTIDLAQAQAVVQELAGAIKRPPVNASAVWHDGRVEVTPGHSGEVLDSDGAVAQITQAILVPLNDRQAPPDVVPLPCRETPPRITTDALREVDTVLGSYSTSYASSSANRANNVVEAAKTINHTIVMPGETFSFNKTVGPRSEDTGFLEAPVIVHGKMETGIGGGICQVSTTLYNAVLLANLQIVTRNHHSLPSHYVPTGLDATVSYGTLDFRFRNSSTAPVVIESQQGGGRLMMRVLGKGPAAKVRIERSDIKVLPSRTETLTDPTLPTGTRRVVSKGRPTKEVTVYRVVDGTREFLSHDRYEGDPTVIRVGTGPAKPKTPAVTPTLTGTPPGATPPTPSVGKTNNTKIKAKAKPKSKVILPKGKVTPKPNGKAMSTPNGKAKPKPKAHPKLHAPKPAISDMQ